MEAELHSVAVSAQRERDRRTQLEQVETELRGRLTQVTNERDAMSQLKEQGTEDLNAARTMLRAAREEAEGNL
eukprot:235370-Alexandrium_andersonii.AAC.1